MTEVEQVKELISEAKRVGAVAIMTRVPNLEYLITTIESLQRQIMEEVTGHTHTAQLFSKQFQENEALQEQAESRKEEIEFWKGEAATHEQQFLFATEEIESLQQENERLKSDAKALQEEYNRLGGEYSDLEDQAATCREESGN